MAKREQVMMYDLKNSYDVEKFRKKIAQLLDGGCMVELKKVYPQRTMPQNRYYQVITEYFGACKGYTKLEVQADIFMRQVNADLCVDRQTGRLKSSTELTVDEMAIAIDRFRNWSASEENLYIPSGDEYRALFYAQQVIAANKEYLYESETENI